MLVLVWELDRRCKNLVKTKPLWSINSVHREGNLIAHVLAKHSLCLTEEIVWIEEVPNVIIPVVLADISNQ